MKSPGPTLTRTRRRSDASEEREAANEIALAFDDNRLASIVFGHYDQNIARIERRLGVVANANGNQILIRGPREASEQARRVFEMLYSAPSSGRAPEEGDVEGAIEEITYQGTCFPAKSRAPATASAISRRAGAAS